MAIINRIGEFGPDMAAWRQHLHTIPELNFDCPKTAAYIQERLAEIGVDEVHPGIAQTGIVAIIEGQGDGPTIGLRADFDALPMSEETGLPYASTHAGKMHACGHDGHTAMLLGAAKYMVETRNFSGRVALIFQPAEEDGGGGEVMVQEGIMERFGIGEVYAIHNAPGLEAGSIHTRGGPIMAAADVFHIHVTGRGGHAAEPHTSIDSIVAASSIVSGLQTIASRNHDTLGTLVLSVTQFHAGTTDNVIPETAYINGTIRTFDTAVRDMAVRRLTEIAEAQAKSFGCSAAVKIDYGYPPTVNHDKQAAFAATVAAEVVGESAVSEATPIMASEDFSYMLEARPGAYLMLGQGDSAGVHHPKYDFNDDVAPIGASFFARLVETAQPVDR
ncbi:M20 aminoacylase family protein [uncultured Tateyamaria sp.]|uniref:M20 aminoacylase family protein n=1 Tax=Tateyamaria sp. 1078 TaxID=3417464 RepID=UPI0026026B56|nr:M20 aminoacylase family protein [uncultured Tateyamaria sp.]